MKQNGFQIVMEYMDLMGIKDTQFILVRHNNTDNPHCHLIYNRIGYDGKVISSQSDYKRNEFTTKKLKDKYRLTFKASQISRDFSFTRLNAKLSWSKPGSEQEFEPKKPKQEPILPMARFTLQQLA